MRLFKIIFAFLRLLSIYLRRETISNYKYSEQLLSLHLEASTCRDLVLEVVVISNDKKALQPYCKAFLF